MSLSMVRGRAGAAPAGIVAGMGIAPALLAPAANVGAMAFGTGAGVMGRPSSDLPSTTVWPPLADELCGAGFPSSRSPHSPQKRAPGSSGAWHFGQRVGQEAAGALTAW